MLDLKYILGNLSEVKANCKRRSQDPKMVDLLFEEYVKQKEIVAKRHAHQKEFMEAEETEKFHETIRLRQKISSINAHIDSSEKYFRSCLRLIPNNTSDYTSDEPLILDQQGEEVEKKFNHVEIGEELKLMDFGSASRVASNKFYYLKNEAILLENALIAYVCDILLRCGYELFRAPHVVTDTMIERMGFNARGSLSDVYSLDGSILCMVNDGSIPLGALHSGTVIDIEKLTIKYAGITQVVRKEKHFTDGLYNVNQSTQIDLFCICQPKESNNVLEKMVSILEEIHSDLKIPYRLVEVPAPEMHMRAYRQVRIEGWMPGKKMWKEMANIADCTNYVSQSADIRYKDIADKGFVHTVNGIALSIPLIIIALLENHQQPNKTVKLPDAIAKYVGANDLV